MSDARYILATSKPWHASQLDRVRIPESNFVWVHTPDELANLLKASNDVQYIFFLHWSWLVPHDIWAKHECVCFHMTDLPYGRGGSPLQNLILKGHTETQLSALRMEADVDAGPVYTKRPLSLEGRAEDIYVRAGEISFDIICWIIENRPEPVRQTGEPFYFERRKPTQSTLPVSGSLVSVYNHIRMLDAPTYPRAFIEHGDFIVEFSNAQFVGDQLTASVTVRRNRSGDNDENTH